jgi:hypothetical protein
MPDHGCTTASSLRRSVTIRIDDHQVKACARTASYRLEVRCSLQASYFEAVVEEINPKERTVVACFPKDVGFAEACFKARSRLNTDNPVGHALSA